MTSDARRILDEQYEYAEESIEDNPDYFSELDSEDRGYFQIVIDHVETNKGVFAVLATLFLKKILDPDQDIRAHMRKLPGGFSGRGLDTREVTPFFQEKGLQYMQSGSGWLTRSLEQSEPYDQDYPGAIRPVILKDAFLQLISNAELGGVEYAELYLRTILRGLISYREQNTKFSLMRPVNMQISQVTDVIQSHLDSNAQGASRLAVLAVYALLEVLINEMDRYRGCKIVPLESHTTADSKSQLIGDINIIDEYGTMFEGFEIKHRIPITVPIIRTSVDKLKSTTAERYYILTTFPHNSYSEFATEIRKVSRQHGCQLIVNGVFETIRYYLRLVGDSKMFINAYVNQLESDYEVPLSLKRSWNRIVDSASEM